MSATTGGLERIGEFLICPACNEHVIAGEDSCPNCLFDLAAADIPETAQALSRSELTEPLSEVRLAKLLVLPPSATVQQGVDLLRSDPGNAVVIVGAAGIVGIFTERDVLLKVAAGRAPLDLPLDRVMTHDPVVLRESDTMAVALNKMGDGGFRHIPLVNDGQVVAMVTAPNIIAWMMERYFD
jgi:CBS domain-containing protein